MGELFRSVFAIILMCAVQCAVITNDEFVTVEDEPYRQNLNGIISDTESIRRGRILWPYPLDNKTETTESKNSHQLNAGNDGNVKARKKRFLHWSYPQSPIVDMMMQTMAINYSPTISNDPFDFLRDSYPVPTGK